MRPSQRPFLLGVFHHKIEGFGDEHAFPQHCPGFGERPANGAEPFARFGVRMTRFEKGNLAAQLSQITFHNIVRALDNLLS